MAAREVQRVNFEQARNRIEKREAGVVMMNDALECGDDAAKKFGEFAAGDQDVVDFEKDLETVAFAGELLLVGLGGFVVECVIDGDGHLAGDALHELKDSVGHAIWDDTAEAHGAETALSGGQRKNSERADIDFAEAGHEFGVAVFLFDIGDDEGKLCLPDPARGMADYGSFRASGLGGMIDARFENMEAHDVAHGIMQYEREKIEIDDGMEALGELVEKRGKIALLGNRLADFEQSSELPPGVFKRRGKRYFRRRNDVFRHRSEDSTRVGEGST